MKIATEAGMALNTNKCIQTTLTASTEQHTHKKKKKKKMWCIVKYGDPYSKLVLCI